MKRLRVTIMFDYDANPEIYETDDSVQMAWMVRRRLSEFPELALDLAARSKFLVDVLPLEENRLTG